MQVLHAKRKRGKQLDQRRMLGIDAEICTLPIPVAGPNVRPLIPGLRLLPYRKNEFARQQDP